MSPPFVRQNLTLKRVKPLQQNGTFGDILEKFRNRVVNHFSMGATQPKETLNALHLFLDRKCGLDEDCDGTSADAPDRNPFGNQSVALGSSLTVQLGASDPAGDPLRFGAMPLPLPGDTRLDAVSSLFTFRPTAAEVGDIPVTFSTFRVRSSKTTFNLLPYPPARNLHQTQTTPGVLTPPLLTPL